MQTVPHPLDAPLPHDSPWLQAPPGPHPEGSEGHGNSRTHV
jgi:hypothetical protein